MVHIPKCPEECKAWHSPNQVAGILGISRRMVYKLMQRGKLNYEDHEIGRRIQHTEITRYVQSGSSEAA